MRIDVSEVKTYRECKRKHQFSSRNRMHLRPIAPNDNLVFGTQFHECLAMMYMGTSLESILEFIDREVKDSVYWKTMTNMVKGYYEGPFKEDIQRYVVVDVEKSFNYPVALLWFDESHRHVTSVNMQRYNIVRDDVGAWHVYNSDGEECLEPEYRLVCACGSIDMVVIDSWEGTLCGFEHKTAKNFRPDVYDLIDEQPRLYSCALKQILEDYHKQGKYTEIEKTGAIFLNQVKKLQTKFDYKRSVCKYTDDDLDNFMWGFRSAAEKIALGDNIEPIIPEPGFMKCQMCDYADICMHFGYQNLTTEKVLDEFEGEYAVREFDHLDEKVQRHNTEADE